MLERIRSKLSFANVVSLLALFVALSGSAYAVTQIDRNSVKSKHIVDGEVSSADVRNDSLSDADISNPLFTATEPNLLDAGLPNLLDEVDHGENCPSTAHGWFNDEVGRGLREVGYYRDSMGDVHLTGAAIYCDGPRGLTWELPPNDSVVFTLPPGFRPKTLEYHQALWGHSYRNASVVRIHPDGRVMVGGNTGEGYPWLSLDSVEFRCAPSGDDGCP